MSVRAKFVVKSVDQSFNSEQVADGGRVVLEPVVSGSPENEQFYKYTPSGSLVISTINQSALSQFEVGKEFYVDLTPAE